MLADRRYCYPLTITDFASRYLICCEALSSTQELYAFAAFERIFKDFGLPRAIRTDNGLPFASANALFGLSRLSALSALSATLQRPARARLSLPRPHHHRHPLWPHLAGKTRANSYLPCPTPASYSSSLILRTSDCEMMTFAPVAASLNLTDPESPVRSTSFV
jgi:hypothetical protein